MGLVHFGFGVYVLMLWRIPEKIVVIEAFSFWVRFCFWLLQNVAGIGGIGRWTVFRYLGLIYVAVLCKKENGRNYFPRSLFLSSTQLHKALNTRLKVTSFSKKRLKVTNNIIYALSHFALYWIWNVLIHVIYVWTTC